MCVVCTGLSNQFQKSQFVEGAGFSGDSGLSLAAGGDMPLAFLNLIDRGGTAANGLPSLLPGDAGAQITRTGLSWSSALGQPATVTYAFRANAPGTMPSDTSGFSQFSEAQIYVTEVMLAAWSDVAGITFLRVGSGTTGPGAYSNNATMLFGNYSSGADGAAAFAYLPGSTAAGAAPGDVWINSSLAYNSSPQYMAYGYQVLLHEIGHAIGLSHPAAYNAGAGVSITYSQHALYYEDSRQYTVMSYFGEGNTGASFGARYSSAPLMDDIAAAQRLYGANMSTRTGDTVYGFNTTADRQWFGAGTAANPQAVIFCVWDAGGVDTLDFSGYTQAGTIDLRQGNFSSVGGLIGNVSIAMGVTMENAVGGSGGDTIVGNAVDNRLTGRGGADVIDGGMGTDTAVFSGNSTSYSITNSVEVIDGVSYRVLIVTGPDGTDTLRNVEFLSFANGTIAVPASLYGVVVEGDATDNSYTGTAYADWIYGADGADTLNGGAGNDRINGGRGNDILDGGDGIDTVDFSGQSAGVVASLASGTATSAQGNDTLANFENMRGTTSSDTLTGNNAANVIEGNGGIDTLNGNGGDDRLVAGSGLVVGAEDVIKTSGTANTSRVTAVNIDDNFDRMNDPGVVNATSTPHAVIRGTGSGGGQEYYAFTVTAGAACTFDIGTASFDTTLRIFDSAGNQLAVNDDEADGITNSLLTYTFTTGGTYYVAVGVWQSGSGASLISGPVPANGTYQLNVSIPGHAYVEAAGYGSTLNGGDGNDTLVSGLSNDILNGGAGTDTAVFTGNRANYVITDNGGGNFTITGPSGTDTLTGVEFAQFADQTVTLAAPPTGPTNGPDVLQGTTGDDLIDGLAGDDTIDGLAGNDVLIGGAGADALTGGDGVDTADYSGSSAGVTVRLWNGTGAGGDAQGDTLTSIERVVGSAFNDSLIGADGRSDTLEGGNGNDYLAGLTGDDVLIGGAGNDTLVGGSGADLFVFAGASGSDRITDFGVATGDLIRLDANLFTDFNDVLTHTTDTANGAVISKSGVVITLTGVTKAQLNAGHFEFAAPAPLEPQAKDAEPPVLPGLVEIKDAGPLVLPGLVDDDLLVLPALADSKDAGPLVLPGLAGDGLDPLVAAYGPGAEAAPGEQGPIICLETDGVDATLAGGSMGPSPASLTDLAGHDQIQVWANAGRGDWLM